jgi:hypothetical protein
VNGVGQKGPFDPGAFAVAFLTTALHSASFSRQHLNSTAVAAVVDLFCGSGDAPYSQWETTVAPLLNHPEDAAEWRRLSAVWQRCLQRFSRDANTSAINSRRAMALVFTCLIEYLAILIVQSLGFDGLIWVVDDIDRLPLIAGQTLARSVLAHDGMGMVASVAATHRDDEATNDVTALRLLRPRARLIDLVGLVRDDVAVQRYKLPSKIVATPNGSSHEVEYNISVFFGVPGYLAKLQDLAEAKTTGSDLSAVGDSAITIRIEEPNAAALLHQLSKMDLIINAARGNA